jgi:hypothetical protein
MLTSIERLLMKNDYGSKAQVKIRLSKLTEAKIINAISVIAGDEESLLNFIHCADELSYQMMRPSPRLKRTQQIYNDLRNAWRLACGYHMYNWENILQMNSAMILQEVPLIKTKCTGISEFMGRMRSLMGRETKKEAAKK